MERTNSSPRGILQSRWRVLPVLILILLVVPAQAQDPGSDPVGGATSVADQTRLRQEIGRDIADYPGTDGPIRERMMNNLGECFRHGMTDGQVRALFPEAGSSGTAHVEAMLAMQDRVLDLADRDLAIEPVMDKIMEGRTKHVPYDRLEPVVDRLGHSLQVSHRIMMEAIDDGVTRPATRDGMHDANRDLARCLWDGLGEHDLEHLAEQARVCARDRDCHTDDLVAASQAATRFTHSGMDRAEAVTMAGEAIRNGYSAASMRAMGDMMVGAAAMNEHHAEMTNHMREWIHEGMSMDDMTRHMMEGGWMGPADMMGPGGHNPMDNMGGGGPGHHGGMGGEEHGGGMDGH